MRIERSRFRFRKEEEEEKTQRSSRSTQTNAPSGDVSLRRGHADGLGGSSLGQGEHYFVGVVLCVLKSEDYTCLLCAPLFCAR